MTYEKSSCLAEPAFLRGGGTRTLLSARTPTSYDRSLLVGFAEPAWLTRAIGDALLVFPSRQTK